MNKFNYILMAVAVLMMATACSNKNKSREERVEEFRSMLTSNDTTQMLQICDNAMEQLKGKKIDHVLASLYEYNDSTEELKPLSDEYKKRVQKRFKLFPVQEYERQYYSFMLEGCNDVKYEVTFRTAEQTGGSAAKTMFMFNPVKIDGEWKLCVKTATDEIDEEHL
jgi:endo-1,4-beta-D-glucanase Y